MVLVHLLLIMAGLYCPLYWIMCCISRFQFQFLSISQLTKSLDYSVIFSNICCFLRPTKEEIDWNLDEMRDGSYHFVQPSENNANCSPSISRLKFKHMTSEAWTSLKISFSLFISSSHFSCPILSYKVCIMAK